MVMIPRLAGTPHPIDELLQQAAWTRRLARSLVRDDALAEDVAQDVWLAASRRPPRAAEPLRPWLRTVVRNLVFNLTRERRRRVAREAAADAPEAAESAEQVLERLQLHKLLVDVVGELVEPYRTAVLLRYFDGLSSAEIGVREHLPPGTVRGRLKMGLQLLREALDRRMGSRKRWVLPIMNFADAPADTGASAAKAFRPSGRSIAGASLALAAAAAVFVVVVRSKSLERSYVDHDDRSLPAATPSDGARTAAVARGSNVTPTRSSAQARLGSETGAVAQAGAGAGPANTLTGTVTVRQPFPANLVGRVRDGHVASVVVRIVKGLPDSFPVPVGEVQLALRNGTLEPHVQVGRIGQSIVVENTDDVGHALRIRQGQATLLERTIAGKTRSPAIAIPRSLETIRLECFANPPTVAAIVPADNPFHAVTAEDGRFVLNDLPAGVFTLQAEDDSLGTQSVDVIVPSALPAIVFAFDGDGPAPRVHSGACTIATIGRGPVGAACATGGRTEAKKLMKTLVKQSNASGVRLFCDGCHQNLDDYTLREGARARLDKLMASAPTSR